MFACEGLIAIIDERPKHHGECNVVTPDELRERINSIARPYRMTTRADMTRWQQQRHDAIIRGCQDADEAIKEAKAMGDPSDPKVQEWWRKHRRNSTIRISLSAGSSPAGYPEFPELPLGKYTGRTAEASGTLPTKPLQSTTVMPHRPPQRKVKGLILDL